MKFIRIVSMICAVGILTSSYGFAWAVKRDPRATGSKSRTTQNDIVFEDFKSSPIDGVPAGFSRSSSNVGITVADTGNGEKKNCLLLNDETYSSTSYSGENFNMTVSDASGKMLGLEVRYKFVDPLKKNDWLCYEMNFRNSENKLISQVIVPSAMARTIVNNKNDMILDSKGMIQDSWYTVKWIVDFEQQEVDCIYVNEATGEKNALIAVPFLNQTTKSDITKFHADTAVNGGQYYIDYIRVSKETERADIDNYIKKGMPIDSTENILNGIKEDTLNLSVDGNIYYPTQAPYVTEDGKTVMTAKNLAGALDFAYIHFASKYMLSDGNITLTIDADTKKTELGKSSATLSVIEEKENQLLVSIEEICKLYKIEYSYDSEKSLIDLKKETKTDKKD